MEQPNFDIQRELDSILEATPDKVEFMGRKVNVHWIRYGAERKISHIMLTEEESRKREVKLCATLLLNNKWRILFFYWILWRWLYYISDVNSTDILRLIVASKKKMQTEVSIVITTLAIGMMDTMMTMRKEEAKYIRAAQTGELPTHLLKNSHSSLSGGSE